MAKDPLDYEAMMDRALRGVVRAALQEAAAKGLPGRHHFYITFRTHHPGVSIADHLRQTYPEEMTIVLEHQFWGLKVEDDAFMVTLSFKGVHERLVIPFAGITAFIDPSVKFGLQLQVAAAPAVTVVAKPPAVAAPPAPEPAPEAAEPAAAPAPAAARVVTLDQFRKKQ